MNRTLLITVLVIALMSIGWSAIGQEAGKTGLDRIDEPEAHKHGVVHFPVSCNDEAQQGIETGLAHLHHMMYEQARPHFEAAAKADPSCAMAHWGIAMTSFQPLWHPTSEEGLKRGKSAVEAAKAIGGATEREQGYIAAVNAFFTDPEPPAADRPSDHEARLRAWKNAQRELHEAYPEDVDAAAFYALAEVCYAMTQFSPEKERDYTRERRAGALLEKYFEDHPEHPGLFHYLIHAYDSPKLAHKAEEAARGYDQLAPDTTHALHMPSHIFVRLGHWKETVEWNQRSAAAALREADTDPHATAHYVHALDYMMYGYLQLGDDAKAKETLNRVQEVEEVWPAFFGAYNMAALQARYYLEQQRWEEAAELEPRTPDAIAWERFPAAEALFHYARGLGAARTGALEKAEAERARIDELVTTLRDDGDVYWAYLTEALGKAVEAWALYERGGTEAALALMSDAADLEDSMDKHPVTPGEVLPVRELYGELLLREDRAEEALEAFQASLKRTPERRNALRGAERAGTAGSESGSLRGPHAADDRQAIAAIAERFVERSLAGDWVAVADLYHPDAVQLAPDQPPTEGRENIRQALARSLGAEGGVKLVDFSVKILEIEGIGDLVYVRAEYRFELSTTVDGREVTVEQHGPYVNILRRNEAGDWLIYRQIYNRAHPPVDPDA